MQKLKQLNDTLKEKRALPDWGGLSNENRNENLARMPGPTSFEKDENDRDKDIGSKVREFQHSPSCKSGTRKTLVSGS